MILNARDKITRCLLSLARTSLLYYPYYRHHLPWPSVLLIENTNCCNAQCVMCPRDTLTRKREFMEFGLFEKIINAGLDTIEYKGNLEWAGVVRDQKELWEARL